MGNCYGFIVAGWYTTQAETTCAEYAVRFTDGTKKVFAIEAKPYFYVPVSTRIPDGMNVTVDNTKCYNGIDGTVLKRIYTKAPFEVKEIRREFSATYEADIPFVDRVRYDLGLRGWVDENFNPIKEDKSPDHLRIMYLDIEVDDSRGFPKPQKADAPVLCIVAYDNYTKRYGVFTTEPNPSIQSIENVKVIKCNSEMEMYTKFLHSFTKLDPDIITGWYAKGFDLPYLMSRFGFTYKSSVCLDLLDCYMKIHENEVRSYGLNYIANLELGMGKIKRKKIFEEYNDGTLSKYCLNDVELCVKLNEKLKLIDFVLGISAMSGCNIENSIFNSCVVDSFVFFELGGKYIQKTKPERVMKEDSEEDLVGAVVIPPKPGIYDWVAEIDNTAEYPNIMISWGLSPDKDATFSGIIKKLMALRDHYKKLHAETKEQVYEDKQRVVKFIINSFAGVFGFKKYRNYSPEIFNRITEIARKHLMWNVEFLKRKGFEVLYGDTDSVYFHLGKEMDRNEIQNLVQELNKSYVDFYLQNGGTKTCTLSTKLENIYRRMLFMPVKKRYAGITVDGKVKIRGFEVRRSNVAVATSQIQEKVIRWVLDGMSVKEIKPLIMQEVRKYPLIDFGIPCSLRKEEYSVAAQHVKAAKWSNLHLGKNYGAGSKFLLFFVKRKDTNVIAVDFEDEELIDKFRKEIDIRKQLERTVIMPLQQIFEVVKEVNTLDAF